MKKVLGLFAGEPKDCHVYDFREAERYSSLYLTFSSLWYSCSYTVVFETPKIWGMKFNCKSFNCLTQIFLVFSCIQYSLMSLSLCSPEISYSMTE